MPGLGHREPGPVGAALGGSVLVAGVIVDGLHVHPWTVVATRRALGRDRFLAVSDATAALGLPDGEAWLGAQRVRIEGPRVSLAEGPATLAGSGVGLDTCVRLLSRFTGCDVTDALAAATTVPAALIGRDDLGTLTPGARADVLLLDGDLEVAATVVGGEVRYDRDGRSG
jgi:N-acetylglucosamine-6-phosphate deacetylase